MSTAIPFPPPDATTEPAATAVPAVARPRSGFPVFAHVHAMRAAEDLIADPDGPAFRAATLRFLRHRAQQLHRDELVEQLCWCQEYWMDRHQAARRDRRHTWWTVTALSIAAVIGSAVLLVVLQQQFDAVHDAAFHNGQVHALQQAEEALTDDEASATPHEQQALVRSWIALRYEELRSSVPERD